MQRYAIKETWPFKKEDVIKLNRNNARMVSWMRNVRTGDRLGLQLNRVGKVYTLEGYICLVNCKRWKGMCRAFRVNGSLPRGQPRKIWNKVIKSDLKERKVS